jgi:hypothetical protein
MQDSRQRAKMEEGNIAAIGYQATTGEETGD